MRVLHLSSTLRGGAGIAAGRLHESLLDLGVKSSLHTLNSNGHKKPEIVFEVHRNFSKRIWSKLLTIFQLKVLSKKGKYVTPISLSAIDVKTLFSDKPDIIHIHSTYNLLNCDDFNDIEKLGIPVVFTLHDQRLFTGGCHYSDSCENFRSLCEKCPQTKTNFQALVSRSHIQMVEQFGGNFKHHVVTPSKWLLEQSMESAVFKNSEHTVIHNPIPEYAVSNKRLESTVKNKTIGFIATNINNPVKNLEGLVSGLKFLDSKNYSFNLIIAGEGLFPAMFENINIERVQINSTNDLVDFYTKISLLVVPSLEDNSPNVIGESLMCGTKVVGSKVGGIPELLGNSEALLFDPHDAEDIAATILRNLDEYDKSQVRSMAKEMLGYDSIASQYVDLYKSMI